MKKRIIIGSIILLVVLTMLYLYFENTNLQVSNYDIVNEKMPNSFNDYKIIQISDFHNTNSKKLVKSIIQEIKNQKPNIIVLTGDFIDSKNMAMEVVKKFISNIKEVAPIYFVSGNHEASINNYSTLKDVLKDNDVIVLDNKVITLKIDNDEINLIGLDDPKMFHEASVNDSEIIKVNLNNLDYDKNKYTILLSHRPEIFDAYVNSEIDLVLTGHAHGGQVRIPFVGGLVAPNQGLFPKYTSGVFESNKTTMIVSRGIGNSIIPFRINNNPEMIVITLNNDKKL